MPTLLLEQVFRVYADYLSSFEQTVIAPVFHWHGGEPLLCGKDYFRQSISSQQKIFAGFDIKNTIQTNATMLDKEWIDILKSGHFSISISFDGIKDHHDSVRMYRNGLGSYDDILRAIELLKNNEIPFQTLVVVNPKLDAKGLLQHFTDLGCNNLDFLLPLHNCDTIPKNHAADCADFLMQLFDVWFSLDNPSIRIRYFESVLKKMLGGEASLCSLRNNCNRIITIEPNGQIGLCDDLSIVDDTHLFRSALNIYQSSFNEIELWVKQQIRAIGVYSLPLDCKKCDVYDYCVGDCPSTRYSSLEMFYQPSAYCPTFKAIINHMINTIGYRLLANYAKKPMPAKMLVRGGAVTKKVCREQV